MPRACSTSKGERKTPAMMKADSRMTIASTGTPKTNLKTNTTPICVTLAILAAAVVGVAAVGPQAPRPAKTRYVVHEAPANSHDQLLAADDAAWAKATDIKWGSAGAE